MIQKKWLILSFASIAIFILPAILLYPFNADNDTWQWIGTVFVRYGGLPYIAAWDNAFPGVALAHISAIYLFGNTMLAFRFVEYLVIAVTILALYRTSRLWLSQSESLIGCVVFSLFYVYGRWDCMGQRDNFAVFPIILSIFFFVKAARGNGSGLRYKFIVAGGAMIGIASWFRPTHALLLVIPILSLYRITNLRAAACAFAGFIVPILLFLLPYVLIPDGISKAYFAAIRYNSDVYSHIPPNAERFMLYLHNLLELRTMMIFVLGAAWIVVYVRGRAHRMPCIVSSSREQSFLILFVGTMLFGMFSQQALSAAHFTPFYACFIPVLTKTLSDLTRPMGRWRPAMLVPVLLTIVCVLYPWGLVRSFVGGKFSIVSAYRFFPQYRIEEEDSLIASYLTRHTSPNEYIEVIGDPGVSWRTPRRKSNRFWTGWQSVIPSYTGQLTDYQREWAVEDINSLRQTSPRFIVISCDPGQAATTLYSGSIARSPEIQDFVQQHYILDTLLNFHVIYARR